MKKTLMLTVLMLAILAANIGTKSAHAVSTYTAQASWYGPGLYGNPLACGGRLSTSTWGVANKYLRCGTKIHICYRRCVVTRVIDRGPYVAGRDFDLTYPVKRAIGMPSVGQVRWWIG